MKFHSITPLRFALAALLSTARYSRWLSRLPTIPRSRLSPAPKSQEKTAPAAPVAPVVAQGPQLLEQAPAVLPDGTTFPTRKSMST